jgi:hypothetical protein
MKPYEILKNNKLIAEFMGKSRPVQGNPNNPLALLREGGIFFPECRDSPDGVPRNFYAYHELKYNCNWHWLMPVVEKIGSTDWSSVDIHWGTGSADSFAWCDISWSNGKGKTFFKTSDSLNSDEQSLITAIWLAVVEFIKWYNKRK